MLLELPRLPAPDRQEILDRLLDLEESDVLHVDDPTGEEKMALDVALDAFACNPGAGRPWREVLIEIREQKASWVSAFMSVHFRGNQDRHDEK